MNKKSNILICGVVKNAQARIERNLLLCQKLGEMNDNHKIIVYENNSSDNTKTILKKAQQDNDDLVVISEDFSEDYIKNNSKIWAYTKITGSNHPCRVEQISNARNKLIEEIRKEIYSDYSIVVFIDLDSNGFDVDSINNSVSKVSKDNNLVLFGNSHPNFYDYYELRAPFSAAQLLGPEIYGDNFWSHKKQLSFAKGELIPVYSAFNGVAIYPKLAIKNNNYGVLLSEKVRRTYLKMIEKHFDLIEPFINLVKNEDVKFKGGHYDEELGVFWKCNSGYDNVLIPEHVFLNFSLIQDGYNLFIDTNINYNWAG